MGKKNKDELAYLQKIQKEFLFYGVLADILYSYIIPVAHALGIRLRFKHDYTEGYVAEYVSCIEGSVLYIYGYRHPVTKAVRVQCYFDWREAQRKYYGESRMLDTEMVNYYIAYGAIIGRGCEAALAGMNATQEDYTEYIRHQHKVIHSLQKPIGYVGGLRGLLAAWRIIFGSRKK